MLTLRCLSYGDNTSIPPKFAHGGVKGGKNLSPGFSWEDPPLHAKSFAFSIIDPHPVAKNWIHWIVIDIPFRQREIPEGASRSERLPQGARELKNSYRETGYGGPEPPRGSGVHPYVATLYALNVPTLGVKADATLGEFLRSLDGKVIQEATMTGLFEQR